MPMAVLERVRDGLAALGTRTVAAPPASPSGGIHVPAALLPKVFVPQGTAAGGMVWFAFGSGDDAPGAERRHSFGWFSETGVTTP